LFKEAKAELHRNTHPDPYCVPFMPGGSLFMRNPPIPLEVCFPNGNYPADAPKVTFNPDMSVCKTETGKSAVGSVLVDFTKKNME
jgi:NADH dehydrogenase (ubiquinone) 1 beta subcomplex subunit 9